MGRRGKELCVECYKRIDGVVDTLINGKCSCCRDINEWWNCVNESEKPKRHYTHWNEWKEKK